MPDISELLQRAGQALQQDRLSDAQEALDGAKAVNPTQLGLWSLCGEVSVRKGDLPGAIADYRRELQLHPAFLSAYPPLASAQIAAKRHDDAAATLREWQKADPTNSRPLTMLVGMLVNDGKAAEAVKAGEEGMSQLPQYARSDGPLLFYLGTAEYKTGNRTKAIGMWVDALRTDDLAIKNSAAYALADANVDLPLADAAQRDVLERMSLVTEGWTLNENILVLLSSTGALAAAWDTMGWILFREGKTADAERYLRAAWRNSPHGTIGEHLGEVEAARGNHRAALEDYQLALAAEQKAGTAGQSAEDADTLPLLKQRIAAEQKSGVRSGITDPQAALLRLRTWKLGSAGGRNGTAQYRMLLGRGRVVRSETALRGGKSLPGAPELIAHAAVEDFFPGMTYSQLVHVATLKCNGSTCDLVMDQ